MHCFHQVTSPHMLSRLYGLVQGLFPNGSPLHLEYLFFSTWPNGILVCLKGLAKVFILQEAWTDFPSHQSSSLTPAKESRGKETQLILPIASPSHFTKAEPEFRDSKTLRVPLSWGPRTQILILLAPEAIHCAILPRCFWPIQSISQHFLLFKS